MFFSFCLHAGGVLLCVCAMLLSLLSSDRDGNGSRYIYLSKSECDGHVCLFVGDVTAIMMKIVTKFVLLPNPQLSTIYLDVLVPGGRSARAPGVGCWWR